MLRDPGGIDCRTTVYQTQCLVGATDKLGGHRLQHLADFLVSVRDRRKMGMFGKKLIKLFLRLDNKALENDGLRNLLSLVLLALAIHLHGPSIQRADGFSVSVSSSSSAKAMK